MFESVSSSTFVIAGLSAVSAIAATSMGIQLYNKGKRDAKFKEKFEKSYNFLVVSVTAASAVLLGCIGAVAMKGKNAFTEAMFPRGSGFSTTATMLGVGVALLTVFGITLHMYKSVPDETKDDFTTTRNLSITMITCAAILVVYSGSRLGVSAL